MAEEQKLQEFSNDEDKKILYYLRKYRDSCLMIICAVFIGAVTGIIDAVFGYVLIKVGEYREYFKFFLIPFLAFAGMLIVFLYKKFGNDSVKGMTLIFEKAQGKREHIPLVLIPLVTVSTWLTHLFGGSAGREGVAVQIGGTIGGFCSKITGIKNSDKVLTITGMAAGFGGLFRTPIAATFFAIEVISAGRIDIAALLPALVSAFTASCISGLIGLEKFTAQLETDFEVNSQFIIFLCIAGILFGIIGGLFAYILEKAKKFFTNRIQNPYKRIIVTGIIVSLLSLILFQGRYSGLGTNLISLSFSDSNEAYFFDFALKFILTIITLAGGFQGGEVTPLFSIGATFGIVFGTIFNMPFMLFSAMGYAAVFGAATNTFIAPIFIGAEIFGYEYIPYFFIVCVLAYIFNGNNCIYSLQERK